MKKKTVRHGFSSLGSAGVVFFFFFVRILMMSKRGKLRAVFILKRGFHPSAVVGEGP